jgi:hypothetical protein
MAEQASDVPQGGSGAEFRVGDVVRHKVKRLTGTVDEIANPKDGTQQLYITWDKPAESSVPPVPSRRRQSAASSLELVRSTPSSRQWATYCELTPTQSEALAAANIASETWAREEGVVAAERLGTLGLDIDGSSGKWRIADNKSRPLTGYA